MRQQSGDRNSILIPERNVDHSLCDDQLSDAVCRAAMEYEIVSE